MSGPYAGEAVGLERTSTEEFEDLLTWLPHFVVAVFNHDDLRHMTDSVMVIG
jgi:hypothetical protein